MGRIFQFREGLHYIGILLFQKPNMLNIAKTFFLLDFIAYLAKNNTKTPLMATLLFAKVHRSNL